MRSRAGWAPARWALWDTRTALIVFVLGVEIAVAGAVADAASSRISTSALVRFAVLLAVGIVFEETSRRVADLRLRVANLSYFDMSSVWTFAAALILPVGLVALLVVLLRYHMWIRYQRRTRNQVYRHVYTCAVIVLCCLVSGAIAHATQHALPTAAASVAYAIAIALALLTYRLINMAFIAAAVVLASPGAGRRALVGTPDANVLELTTLCLGAATAVLALRDPLLLVLMLAPVVVLQRGAMVKELARAATIDAKTGLLNLSTWTHIGNTELNRAGRQREQAALLIVDLDHFKQINDAMGHLAGDEALRLVANAITDELRDYDIIGRFGGEEFVALLPNTGEIAARDAAERLRVRIKELEMPRKQQTQPMSALGVTISTGVACYPRHGGDLRALLDAADGALFSAKRAGRDRVEVAATPPSDDAALGSAS